MKKFNYKLEIEILRNYTQNILGVLRGSFQGFGCPKRHPDALLAKTMVDLIEGIEKREEIVHNHSYLEDVPVGPCRTNLSISITEC